MEDCNHYYAGLNALALLVCQLELVEALPDVWADHVGGEDEAKRELERRRGEQTRLVAAVDWSLRGAAERETAAGNEAVWRSASEADLLLFTATRTGHVRSAYRRALDRASSLNLDAVDRQLRIYEELGVMQANVEAAREVVEERRARVAADSARPATPPARVLMFSGHHVDMPGRERSRFPAAMEDVARDAISAAVKAEIALADGPVIGMAGAASGGDILFHEVCHELGIPTRLYLALPIELYQIESVQDAGSDWVERFRTLCERTPPFVLQSTRTLPDWLQEKPRYTVWQRNNLWLLHSALALAGGARVTLIALWDGKGQGDGPGGTADMVGKARSRGAKLCHLDTNELFGL
jgi:hypothetical protein